MKAFSEPISQDILNIEDKRRKNLFAWRGQFSPNLIESLLEAYCPANSIIFDPYSGSGTVLYEALLKDQQAYGYEINPSAYSFSKIYEFGNIEVIKRESIVSELKTLLLDHYPVEIFSSKLIEVEKFQKHIIGLIKSEPEPIGILLNALVIMLDLYNNELSPELLHSKFNGLASLILDLPFRNSPVKAILADSRQTGLADSSVDFVVTSPPYINVFNYHQNYRKSVELLGWDVLKIAQSEIGSNRANRGNRFKTVIQYAIDMSQSLIELSRVLSNSGRLVMIVGHESNVLGTRFLNAQLLCDLLDRFPQFQVVLRQKRVFKNRFGKSIHEDVINIEHAGKTIPAPIDPIFIGREVAKLALEEATKIVPAKNKDLLSAAIADIATVNGTPIINFSHEGVTANRSNRNMDKPQPVRYDLVKAILPTPHFDKLTALLNNPRLPTSDKAKVEIAIEKYNEWIAKMDVNHPGNRVHVDELVRVTNEYKKYIELDLIFDSEHDFLYRQKGQIKLDNSILEEFLPHLFIKALTLPKGEYEVGPRKTFAGLRFNSSISTAQSNLQTSVRLKDQDFILGTNLFISTSVNENFEDAEIVETYIGYVCAECKTNLDKTMFQEAVATSRDLKMAVPSSLYFLVCDYLDMTPQSITNTHIDEVLILRKSKRLSASIRQKYRTTADRANNRDEYVSFIDSSQYSPDVFLRMIDKTQTLIDQSDPSTEDVIAEGHF